MEKPDVSKSIAPIFEKLEKLSKAKRFLLFIGIIVVIVAIFVYFVLYPKIQQYHKLSTEYSELDKKLIAAKKTAKELPGLKEEFNKAEIQLKEVMKALPESKEIPSLLESISLSGQEAGLEFILFQPGNEKNQSFYAEIPVSIQISGKYHNVAVFFDKVARLPRIVNIKDIVMRVDKTKKSSDLVTTCTAVTYKFLDIKEPEKSEKKGAPKKKTVTKPGKHA
ncbi:MAG: type 4a pilus biogenesis protein PilO [Desulfobacterales bacterium]